MASRAGRRTTMSRSNTTSGGGVPAPAKSAAHSAAVRSTRGSVSVPGSIVIGMTLQATSTSRGGVSAGGAGEGAAAGADSVGAGEGVAAGATGAGRGAAAVGVGVREEDGPRAPVAGAGAGLGVRAGVGTLVGVGVAFPGFVPLVLSFPGARYPSERSASVVASSGVVAGRAAFTR